MLIKASEIIENLRIQNQRDLKIKQPECLEEDQGEDSFTDNDTVPLTKSIGKISPGKTLHYYSHGNFNLVRLILHIIKQTGPVHVFMTSYSFSAKSIHQLKKRLENGTILSFRVLIDNRVRTMSPKPFQMLSECFDYRCSSVHAKVALLWNDIWKISIVTSQNATDNPKLERGIIFTSPGVFEFDYNALDNEFKRAAT